MVVASLDSYLQDAAEGTSSLEEELEAATKALDSANNLEFSRYSEVLFEVFYAGGMVGAGGKITGEAGAPKLENNVGMIRFGHCMASSHASPLMYYQVLAAEPTREAILPYVKVFSTLARCDAIGGERDSVTRAQ